MNVLIVSGPSWPPKSPRDALLSSPSGRKKYEEMQRRREILGSPLRQSATTPNLRNKARQLLSDGVESGDDDEEEDEETLQLKLAAIEAKLKLKRLQKDRDRPGTPRSGVSEDGNALSRPESGFSFSRASLRSPQRSSRNEIPREAGNRRSPDSVQVPLSPTRRPPPSADPVSPRRYLLGIDKGLRGGEVSLKRPPSSRLGPRPASTTGNRGDFVSHSGNVLASMTAGGDTNRPKSFSERMAEGRNAEKAERARKDRAERVQANRSSAFQFDKAEVEGFKATAQARAGSPVRSPTRNRQAESFSREDVLRSYNQMKPPTLKRSHTSPSMRKEDEDTREPRTYFHRRSNKSESEAQPPILPCSSSGEYADGNAVVPEKTPDSSKFEPFSGIHLSNRILPHSFLNRTLADKKVLRIPDLLRTIKGPAFELPEDIDTDYVVFGIVASKSEPKAIKDRRNNSTKEADPFDDGLNNPSRYMVITLTDLKWSIDLFLFDTAFPRYYRISEGMLIAILNPTIMPPPKHKLDTNKFSLNISSSDDKLLEVGNAQDIGFCKAVRKDGKTCRSWVDGRKTEFCDFHLDLQVRRTQSQRMGVNNGPGMFGPGGRSGARTGFFDDGGNAGGRKSGWSGGRGGYKNGLKPEGPQYDRMSQSTYYVAPAPRSRNGAGPSYMQSGQSPANLIDADHDDPFIAAGMMSRGLESKEERRRKKLAEQKREREIAQRLVRSSAGGVGAEYLRAKNAENISSTPRSSQEKTDPSNQGAMNKDLLTGFRKAGTVKLSPLKRAHDGDRPHGNSGVKKTRFITSKGIKEAGRDSLGGVSDAAVTKNNYDDDDDDDGLDIV